MVTDETYKSLRKPDEVYLYFQQNRILVLVQCV